MYTNIRTPEVLFNRGDCPEAIKKNFKYKDSHGYFSTDTKASVPFAFFKQTWRIQSAKEDKDAEMCYFWRWFLAQVLF